MTFFTQEHLNPSEKTLEFIRSFAYSYNVDKTTGSATVALCLN